MDKNDIIEKNHYKVLFVLPGIIIRYPPGGYDIVFRLAHALNEVNIKTGIIFLHGTEYINNYIPLKSSKHPVMNNTIREIIYLIFPGKKFSYAMHHYKLINSFLFKSDYDYDMLKNIDCYLYRSIDNVKVKADIIIATSWKTAYFVRGLYEKYNFKPFYLVQHSEDDVSFSGKNSANAKLTYTFPFKKIVINQKVYNRFKAEEPLFFHVGIDTKFFKKLTETDDREYIMFPLRKLESKGSIYAIECIQKLLDNKNIKIVAFGDYKLNEIPSDIRNEITYYYRPPRKVLLELYNKSMVFVLPSIVEGMSSPPLEAMACGCAAVVTDNGGVNEYIKDNLNGIMCPIKDSDCLYQKVILLINNKDLREKIIQNGLETAKEFSYDKMNENFINIIKENLDKL